MHELHECLAFDHFLLRHLQEKNRTPLKTSSSSTALWLIGATVGTNWNPYF